MVNRLIMAAAWLLFAGFFLVLNLRSGRTSKGRITSYYSMWLCLGVVAWILINTSLEAA